MAERQGLEPRTPLLGATVFKTASSTDRTRSFVGKWLPSVDLHHDDPVNSRACCFDITGDGPSARYCAAVFHLSNGCSAIELRRMVLGNWSRAPVLPRVPPRSKRGGFADSLARDVDVDVENGGLCGHCSRDLPPDKRLLFVAELTDRVMKWWVVSVTLRRWSGQDSCFTGSSRSLRD